VPGSSGTRVVWSAPHSLQIAMKITKIKLGSYLHFKEDLELDLTYPAGHPKAGEPLQKVCLLGQSSTGKTALLNAIKVCVCEKGDFNKAGIDAATLLKDGIELFYKLNNTLYSTVSDGEFNFTYRDHGDPRNPKLIDYAKQFLEVKSELLKECSPLLINFPFCVVMPDAFRGDQIGVLNAATGELGTTVARTDRAIWDFDPPTIRAIWNVVFSKVERYQKESQDNKLRYFDKISMDTKEAESAVRGYKDWELAHPNPIQELADKCLTPVLTHLNLHVETDLSKYPERPAQGDGVFVIIKDAKGRVIPYPFLSTGTKQIMLTAIPLFFLKPKNSIILFDQPETSLYPNIQRILPEVYEECASDNNQFFFATHSPIVASAFDPWEVVELRFDDDGNIVRKEYYGSERHVDNYHIKPKLLRWDSSYRILFQLDDEGTEEREKKLMELASLEQKIKKASEENEKRALYSKYKTLAGELDWRGL
jgi:hypothetical protein